MSFLSAKNAQLEEDTQDVPDLRSDLAENQKQVDILLVLLGEKEEELEGLMQDMKEIKLMYQDHIKDLMDRIVPELRPTQEPSFPTRINPSPTSPINIKDQ